MPIEAYDYLETFQRMIRYTYVWNRPYLMLDTIFQKFLNLSVWDWHTCSSRNAVEVAGERVLSEPHSIFQLFLAGARAARPEVAKYKSVKQRLASDTRGRLWFAEPTASQGRNPCRYIRGADLYKHSDPFCILVCNVPKKIMS